MANPPDWEVYWNIDDDGHRVCLQGGGPATPGDPSPFYAHCDAKRYIDVPHTARWARVLSELALFVWHGGDLELAAPLIEQVALYWPEDADTQLPHGDLLATMGDVPAAKAAYDRYVDAMRKEGKPPLRRVTNWLERPHEGDKQAH